MVLIALILRIFYNPFANVIQKKLSQLGLTSFFINFIAYLGLTFVCLPIIFHINWVDFDLILWKYAILGGLFGAVGNAFLVKALSMGDLSTLGPINSYKAVVAMILGIFTLGEMPSVYGVLATILIVIGSYFVIDSDEKFSISVLKNKGIIYRFVALVFTAIEALMIKQVIILSDVVTSFLLWAVFGMIFSFIFLIIKREKFQPITGKAAPKFLTLILSFGIMQITTNYVFNHMNVSYALSLFQLSSLVSVIFGYKFFKEKNILRKIVGSLIMITGAVIIIYS